VAKPRESAVEMTHFRNADPEYGARIEAAIEQRRG
jgi:hypothetical protein